MFHGYYLLKIIYKTIDGLPIIIKMNRDTA